MGPPYGAAATVHFDRSTRPLHSIVYNSHFLEAKNKFTLVMFGSYNIEHYFINSQNNPLSMLVVRLRITKNRDVVKMRHNVSVVKEA